VHFANAVGGATGNESVAQMWKKSSGNLYSMHYNTGLLNDFSSYYTETAHVFDYDGICTAIKQLNCMKAGGPNGIPAEAVKYGGNLFIVSSSYCK